MRFRSLLTAGLLVTLTAAQAQSVKNPGSLVYLTTGDWSGFDPAHTFDGSGIEILKNTLETLYLPRGDSPNTYEPLLAVGNPVITDGGRTYTIQLNPKAKFSDGTPVTAEDVRYSIMRQLLMSTDDGPASLLLEPLTGSTAPIQASDKGAFARVSKAVTAKDAHTVVFRLAKPFSPFQAILANPVADVYSKAAAVKAGAWDGSEASWTKFVNQPLADSPYLNAPPVGSAPFVLSRYDKGSQIILKRNDNYWRAPAKLQNIAIKSVNEASTAAQLLKTGDADMIHVGVYPRTLLAQIKGLKNLRVQDQVASLSMQGAFMNFKVRGGNPDNVLGSAKLDGKGIPANFFSDINVRRAFAASFDSAGYIRQQLQGGGLQAGGALIKGIAGYDPSLKYKFDKAAATNFFKKAWGGKLWQVGFTMPLVWDSGNANHQQAALLFKRSVEALNPKFHIDVRELQNSAIIQARSQGQLPMWLGSWGADYADAYNFAQPLLESNGFYPQQNSYKNPKVDALIAKAVASTNPATSTGLYRQAQQLGFGDVAYLPIYQPEHFSAEQTWVKGHAVNPLSGFSAYFYPISK